MHRLTGVTAGVLVATSEIFVTTSTVVEGSGGGCLVIDPAVTVPELQLLAADLAESGLRPAAGFSTHPHWDHLLWCRELGSAARYAAPQAAAVAERERDGLISGVEQGAPGHDLQLFGRLSPLGPGQEAIAWPGPEAVVLTHDGHAPGHSAIFLPDTGTLVAGDMLSDIEIPLPDLDEPDPFGRYRRGLGLLAGLPVRLLIPGHGTVGDAAEFRRRVAADTAYLDGLERGEDVADPRLTADWLRAEHQQQLGYLARRRPVSPESGTLFRDNR
jgi:glyoxylase-like metal-dependent hydrolase (beta-lactamase superfamily II)